MTSQKLSGFFSCSGVCITHVLLRTFHSLSRDASLWNEILEWSVVVEVNCLGLERCCWAHGRNLQPPLLSVLLFYFLALYIHAKRKIISVLFRLYSLMFAHSVLALCVCC